MSQSSQVLDIGVLIFPSYQWLDAAGSVDYLNNHSQFLMKAVQAPDALVNKAPIINWHYLSSEGNLEPIQATSGPKQVPSVTFATCPHLDYILVPGPDPTLQLSRECSSFLTSRFPELKGLLTVCTGSAVLAQTGLLDGYHVASNKVALKQLAERGLLNKKVKWVGDKRFVVDGKIWSGPGITAGIDLAAEFARVHFDPEIVELVELFSEYNPNPAQPDPFAKILEGVKLD